MTRSPEDRFSSAIAHQLKTPASALQASATNLRRNLHGLMEDLAELSEDPGTLGATTRFIAKVVSEPAPPPATGLLPKDRLDVIERRLKDAGIDADPRPAAACLARGGWDTYLDDILPLLRHDAGRVLDLLETASRLRANLSAMDVSVAKIRGLASALRLMGRPAQGDPIDPTVTLESCLTMIRPILPEGVALSLDIGTLPRVAARPELLGEVWANLVTNALHAVGDHGTITIEAVCLGAGRDEQAVIRVLDDGPGIPAELLPRVFEPFYTTRAAEGGSGLGLPLARRIVESIGGEIAVESSPGRTCFTVRLPACAVVQAEA
ncbi:MAG TPA: HAMP domain-containing sensor histidine kinase [Candidatus Polarisedimenticolia bacterium]|nr:HAMP domain-containing sensor histidine kinase [Candidatus Polarisedimenticolia bacterium]